MTGPSGRRDGLGLLGLGVVACAACCAGPILAFVAGLSIAGLASTLAIGLAGLGPAALAAVTWLTVTCRRRGGCRGVATGEAVPVGLPTTREPG